MKSVVVIVILGALAFAGYYTYYPPVVMQRQFQQALDDFSDTVATKDRAKITDAMRGLISDDAKIRLEVTHFSIRYPQGLPPVAQDFDKAAFLTFIDNILFTLTDYEYRPQVDSFAVNVDHSMAAVRFSSKEWADGPSHFNGIEVGMRFSADTSCEGTLRYNGDRMQLSGAVCAVHMRAVPRSDEAHKLQSNPQALGEFLR